MQLFGADGRELAEAARFLETLGVDFIDINLGWSLGQGDPGRGGGGADAG
ncbi:MAG: hypothetical protein HC901_01945 [Bdellovibrionaceae bacterium]|nr:hypothetical protein [Pseudobdellovibrionaceae bacterium]